MKTIPGAPGAAPPAGPAPSRRKGRVSWVILGVLGVGALVIGLLFAKGVYDYSKPPPEFPALVDEPDPTLAGTVAYSDGGCVWTMPVSGAAAQVAYCFEPDAPYDLDWTTLVWLPDGRLEITTHTWPPEEDITVDSQRIVDVTTGEVEEIASDDLPEPRTPDLETGPTVNSAGAELTVENDGSNASLVVTENGETRTLLEASGSPEYDFKDPVWGPDESWVLVDDGRLLLVTVDDSPTTRILLEHGARGFSAGARGWAVTGEGYETQ